VNQVVAFATELADAIIIPHKEISDAFVPLVKHCGGYFTKCSDHINVITGTAMMARVSQKIAECMQKGSDQQQGLIMILGSIGIEGDAQQVLSAHAAETPKESAMRAGKRLADTLNAMPPKERMHSLFGAVCGF
jgi:hypothetical protein